MTNRAKQKETQIDHAEHFLEEEHSSDPTIHQFISTNNQQTGLVLPVTSFTHMLFVRCGAPINIYNLG